MCSGGAGRHVSVQRQSHPPVSSVSEPDGEVLGECSLGTACLDPFGGSGTWLGDGGERLLCVPDSGLSWACIPATGLHRLRPQRVCLRAAQALLFVLCDFSLAFKNLI